MTPPRSIQNIDYRDSLSGAKGLCDNLRDSHLHDLLSKSRAGHTCPGGQCQRVLLSLRMTLRSYDKQV